MKHLLTRTNCPSSSTWKSKRTRSKNTNVYLQIVTNHTEIKYMQNLITF